LEDAASWISSALTGGTNKGMKHHKTLTYLKQLQPLSIPLSSLKGVGPKRAAHLAQKGVHTVLDLLFFTPLRYEDRTAITLIKDAQEGVPSLVRGSVVHGGEEILFPSRTRVFRILIRDAEAGMELVWFNYRKAHLSRFTAPGKELRAYGRARMNRGRLQMVHPDLSNQESKGGDLGFYPVYSSVAGVSPHLLRSIIKKALEDHLDAISDPVPGEVTESLGLPPLNEALRCVHFPPKDSVLSDLDQRKTPAHRRLLFDRFFLVMLTVAFRRKARKGTRGFTWLCPPEIKDELLKFFPFTFTSGQHKAVQDILHDLGTGRPMNRLLLGDVGCGKTAVAALAACIGARNNAQIALLAPTQVLTSQHFDYFTSLPRRMGFRPVLLTGALKKRDKEEACKRILDGSYNLVIGTQALLQEEVRFRNLGLVIIDEQHRFGVRERALMDRKGNNPHQLIMTATPIPRTLAMTVYGDLDISMIKEFPAGHKPALTRLVSERDKRKVFLFLKERLALGQKAFVICPVIEVSEEIDLKNATETAEKLERLLSPLFRVGLMHGRLPDHEKLSVMNDFRRGAVHLLVGTTVVEVGVHVPAATVMIIEHPERFGLAQLHQLRGRVGRGSERGICVLMVSSSLPERALSRLQIMAQSHDGFEIAQKDLEQRGQGEFTGIRQAGLGELDLFEMIRDHDLLILAKEKADALLDSDPDLSDPRHRKLRTFVESILARPIDL
jgi:ATP-dependent DNA helicase RecG